MDIGGFSPDRSHLATLLFLDVALAHRDDWFSFPVPSPFLPREDPPPSSGVVVRLAEVQVKDTFDEWWDLRIPPSTDDAPESEETLCVKAGATGRPSGLTAEGSGEAVTGVRLRARCPFWRGAKSVCEEGVCPFMGIKRSPTSTARVGLRRSIAKIDRKRIKIE